MQVLTYAKYIKDILGNKRTLPTTEVVQLTEECSAAILDPLLEKKKDPGCPTITCSIRAQHFTNTHCDLGASVSVMPKVVYDKLNYHELAPTAMCLQLVDQTVHYPAGIAENISVKSGTSLFLLTSSSSIWRSTPRSHSFWEGRS